MTEVRNWSGVHRFRPYARHWPTSEDEVAAIVRTAHARGERVKVIGAGHSWSDAAVTDGHLLSLDRMQRVLAVDQTRRQVTVEGGIRLRQLNDELAIRGLAMPVLGSISEQSIAGAIATGTHGSGVGYGCLSTAVVGLRLVTATGDLVDAGERDAELLSAARIHLGCLGVVTQVTLQVEPAFRLRERVEIVRFDEALDRMDELAASGEHVKLWWLPHTRNVRVSILDRTEEPPSAGSRREKLAARADEIVNRRLFTALLAMSAKRPASTPAINRLVSTYFTPAERVARSDRVFNLAMPPVHREAEYGVPRERAAEALAAVADLIQMERLRVNFVVEVRFVAADEIFLSGAYQRDSCQLGAYIGECPSRPRYFAGVQSICAAMDGRPHWGKETEMTAAELARVYPALGRFDAVRRRLDPAGTFENHFVRRIFDPDGA